MAIAGEVARHDRVGSGPDRIGDLGLERPVAIAQQHRHLPSFQLATARSSRPSPLKSPATIGVWARPDRVGDLGLERPVAVAEQHRDRVGAYVGDGEVEPAVAIEVTRDDRAGRDPTASVTVGLERAVAVAQQHRHGAGVDVRARVFDGEIEAAVALEVACHDGVWVRPHGVVGWGLERAVAVAQQHRHRVVSRVATARSTWPSPLKSPATMASGPGPTA